MSNALIVVFYPPPLELALRGHSVACILTPLTPGLIRQIEVPFQRETTKIVVRPGAQIRERSVDASLWCGLKGKMALGDAHPYLALFYLSKNEPSPDISVGAWSLRRSLLDHEGPYLGRVTLLDVIECLLGLVVIFLAKVLVWNQVS